MKTHICVPTRRAIEELIKGNNLLNCSPSQALKELQAQEAKGKKYFTGCDKEDETGRCAGHDN